LAGETITVAILVSFTELPSIPELSRFEGDDRRASFTAVPLPDGWLNYFRVPAFLETHAVKPGVP
jgi:hypothetical protein